MRERLRTADLVTKTKREYFFTIPRDSFLINYLTWFNTHGRAYLTEETQLYNAVEKQFKSGLFKVLKGR